MKKKAQDVKQPLEEKKNVSDNATYQKRESKYRISRLIDIDFKRGREKVWQATEDKSVMEKEEEALERKSRIEKKQ